MEEALAEVVAGPGQDMCLEINTRAFNFEGFGSREVYQKYISLLADAAYPLHWGQMPMPLTRSGATIQKNNKGVAPPWHS